MKNEEVMNHLNWDPNVDTGDIRVKEENGTVELNGSVHNYLAKVSAERDAYKVRGISRVQNNLDIRFPPRKGLPSDGEIEERIKHYIDWNDDLEEAKVNIQCHEHVVILTGTVKSDRDKILVTNMTNLVKGVKEVDNHLRVLP